MKRIKLLSPILGLTAITTAIAPLASCSCNQTEEGAKANLTVTSTDGVTIKEASVELNKDSTITLNVPQFKALSIVYINVGTVVLTKDKDFSVDVNTNTIKINGSVLNHKDVEITIFTTQLEGIYALASDQTKVFEALDVIKASDIKVYPKYSDATASEANPLVYGSDYLVYDSTGKEIKDFDTTGYTVTRPDGVAGSKLFNIKYIAKDYTTSLSINTEPRYEPASIDSVYNNKGLFVNDTVTVEDLTVNATMAKEPLSKVLEYGTDYLVYDENGKLIESFGEDGYTFTTVGKHTLTVKSVLNPENAYKDVVFDVLPATLKGATCVTNTGDAEAQLTWTVYQYEGQKTLNPNFEYSIDNGGEWLTLEQGKAITIEPGCSIALKGNNPYGLASLVELYGTILPDEVNYLTFASKESSTSNKKTNINLFGSIMGLLDNNGEGTKVETLPSYCFTELFVESKIASISKGYLGNSKLGEYCYYRMFEGSSIINAPDLPVTKLAKGCYSFMFVGCENLKSAPELPATELTEQCYSSMFYSCPSLTYVPELPATELKNSSYLQMFQECTSLVTAPKMKIEKVDEQCCWQMFLGCSSLKEIPITLSATTLSRSCYSNMFAECTSLTKTPELPAETLAVGCYWCMFYGCTSLTKVSKIKTTKVEKSCYYWMFKGCSNLQISIDEGYDDHLIMTAVQDQVEGDRDDPYYQMFVGTKGWDDKTLIKKDSKYYWVE